MPDDRNTKPNVRVVTNEQVVRELSEMAGVNIRWAARLNGVPLIGPIEIDRLGRFFVVATMVLGAADALMLSIIAEADHQGRVTFPGWEIL